MSGGPTRVDVGAHTNVPRWSEQPEPLGPCAIMLVATMPPSALEQRWLAACTVRRISVHAGVDRAAADAAAGRIASTARVGVRFALLGDELDVLTLRAALLARSVLRGEIEAHAVSNDRIRVRCAHCRAETIARARPLDEVVCSGCGLTLIVHHHCSPSHAAYLGFRVDAEFPRAPGAPEAVRSAA